MARCSQAFSYDHGYHSEFEFEPDDYLAADQDIALLETYTGKVKALTVQLKTIEREFDRFEEKCPALEDQFSDLSEYMGRFSRLADQGVTRLEAIVSDAKSGPYQKACSDIEQAIMDRHP